MKKPYRVGEGANLEAFPHGTKVGHVVMLTDAQAAYERDMRRIERIKDAAEAGGMKKTKAR